MSLHSSSEPHISQERLFRVNQEYWKDQTGPVEGKRWIYVLHTLTTEMLSCIHENIVAKGLQKKEQLPIVSVVSGKKNALLDRLDESFGIARRFHSSYHEYDSASARRRADILAQRLSLATYGKKDKLLGLEYRGIACGDAVHDDILRRGANRSRGEVFDCFDVSRERYATFIRNAVTVIDKAYEMFRERKPAYLITTEYFFAKGLYASVASRLGAKIIYLTTGAPDIAVQIDPDRHLLQDVKATDLIKRMRECCLKKYQQSNGEAESLFVQEYAHGAETANFPAGAPWGRKNVFILPHALSDAPRQVCRHNIYHDYNEWFVDTIRIIKDIPDVNWIVKDHPLASCFHQGSYIRSVFEQNKTPNMFWYDKDFGGMKIKDAADCVVTCSGDPGIEYWAYGVPTITAAEGYYCDWGISYHMRSREEYADTLKHVGELKKPDSKSIETARLYLSAFKNRSSAQDPAAQLISVFLKKELQAMGADGSYFENDSWRGSRLEEITYEFCERFAELIESDGLTSSVVYQLSELYDL